MCNEWLRWMSQRMAILQSYISHPVLAIFLSLCGMRAMLECLCSTVKKDTSFVCTLYSCAAERVYNVCVCGGWKCKTFAAKNLVVRAKMFVLLAKLAGWLAEKRLLQNLLYCRGVSLPQFVYFFFVYLFHAETGFASRHRRKREKKNCMPDARWRILYSEQPQTYTRHEHQQLVGRKQAVVMISLHMECRRLIRLCPYSCCVARILNIRVCSFQCRRIQAQLLAIYIPRPRECYSTGHR